jgi:hypothetical protein
MWGDIPRVFSPWGRYSKDLEYRPPFWRGANLLGGGRNSCDTGHQDHGLGTRQNFSSHTNAM